MSHVIPLDLLANGASARVYALDGRTEFVVRLQEMGLREGVEVRMVRSGSPCIIAIENQRLSFRGEETSSVLVELIV